MNSSSPFSPSKQKKKLKFAEVLETPTLALFKPVKPVLSRGSAKSLVELPCSPSELAWIERWLETYARNRSLPPQCYGKEAFDALISILPPEEMLKVLEEIRRDFKRDHPRFTETKESFQFLLDAIGSDPANTPLSYPSFF